MTAFSHLNGISRHVVTLASRQITSGLQPTIITDREEYLTGTARNFGIHTEVASLCDTIDTERIHEIIKRQKFDIIHIHGRVAAFELNHCVKRYNIPIVYTYHSNTFDGFAIALAASLQNSAVISVSNVGKIMLSPYRGKSCQVFHVPNGLDSHQPEGLRFDAVSRHQLVSVGRLGWEKGLDVAIVALKLLVEECRESAPVLNIIGEGPDRAALQQLARELEIEKSVIFHGEHLNPLHSETNALALIHTSRIDGCPLVILEAMRAGIPVVASRVGGIPEIFPGEEYGLLSDVDSPHSVARGIRKLASTPSLRRAIAANASRRFEREYGADKMASRVNEVYESVR
ncbi:glycosyltransferase family 4 protein [Streptomyces sp. NPDC088775]|uniref:glycosyltransferase family 4 protein n=1 Tax=Streptomyces sp. NPDC088775 TaxID=3365896 RepID=UPI0037F659C1